MPPAGRTSSARSGAAESRHVPATRGSGPSPRVSDRRLAPRPRLTDERLAARAASRALPPRGRRPRLADDPGRLRAGGARAARDVPRRPSCSRRSTTPRRGRRRSPSARSTLVPQPHPGRGAPLPEAAAADEQGLPLVRPVRLRSRALQQPRVREERAHARRARCTSATATRRCATPGRRASCDGEERRPRAASAVPAAAVRGCAARTSRARPGPTCSWPTRATWPSASSATTGARPRSYTRRSTSSTSSGCRAQPEDFYLAFGRVVPYKRVDLAVAACARLGRRLKVAGGGRALDGGARAGRTSAPSSSARSPTTSATGC